MSDVPLRKWYFCLNAKGFEQSWPLVQVAVRSCLRNTRLTPVCLYDGPEDRHAARLESLGASVVRHTSSLADALRRGYGDAYDTYSGHWLRVDIPLVEHEEPVVLYTDIDVLFRAHPDMPRRPRTLAAAPERFRWRWPHFNSGVMVLNLPGMRAVHDDFDAMIRARIGAGRWPTGHDQVCYNAFFRWRHTRLPHRLNWKPYWGDRPDAQIIHFHGPKPGHIDRMAAGDTDGMLPIYRHLWNRNPQAYRRFGREFRELLEDDA